MKKLLVITFLLSALIQGLVQAQSSIDLSLDFSKPGIQVSPSLYGIFFEDINFAADGGIYAELIRNRSFEEGTTYWSLKEENGSYGTMTIETQDLLNEAQTKCIKLSADSITNEGFVGMKNIGFWGINIEGKKEYTLTFFAKCSDEFKGTVTASLINGDGTIEYACNRIARLSKDWTKYTCTLVPDGSNASGSFQLSINATGTVWFDVVSLFPPTYKHRPNGLRTDLAQKLADLHPKFFRFPGGCFVEGNYLANRFQWKKSIGNIEDRPGHNNFWGYPTTDGMGYHEFLQLAEDIEAAPLFVVNVGIAHNDYVTYTSIDDYIQDALDAIEYANGDISTNYGAMRAANGHPEPFNLKYIEIGNENNQYVQSDHYAERYVQFYDAIKAKYPDIICIGDVEAWGTDNPSWKIDHPVDLIDEHYYRTCDWFANKANKYDSYNRTGPKVYVGEYAVTTNGGNGNLGNALGEAAFMTGMERNSDIVALASYAPMFGNINSRQWNPDAIYYNSSKSYGTPSYHVQNMFANNYGNKLVPIRDSLNSSSGNLFAGAIGVATWATTAQFDSITVQSGDSVIINENFNNNATGWTVNGGAWAVNNGVYEQTSTNTDCRSTYGNITLPNYTYRLKAKKISGAEGFLIIFGHADAKNYLWWNIGGWGNTLSAIEQAVNGTKTTLVQTSCVIASDIWYDIRVEVNNNSAKCYLNNILIHTILLEEKYLYASCTTDTAKGDIFLKVVNYSNSDKSTRIKFTNLPVNTSLKGTLQTMTYASLTDENTIDAPNKIAPKTIDFTSESEGFECTFLKNSINVFQFYPQSTILQVSNTTLTIPENSGNGFEVGSVTASGSNNLKYSILSSSVVGAFEINNTTGVITVKDSALLNHEVYPSIILNLLLEDADYDTVPPARGKCVINLSDVNESPVLISNKFYTFANDKSGTSIGKIFVMDEDKGQTYSYSIKSQLETDLLKINTTTGELTLNNITNLNTLVSTKVTFTVEVTDNGSPSLSNEKEYTLEILEKPTLGILNHVVLYDQIEVYPNPAGNYLTIKTAGSDTKMIISLFDYKGTKVFNQVVSGIFSEINTSALSNGIYFLQIFYDEKIVETRKIEIVR